MATEPKRRRIMRSFKINEISAVDRPAQEGARVAIMKRRHKDKKKEEMDKVLPKPLDREKRTDFVSRFMSNGEAKKEFPRREQRLAVAFSRFRTRKIYELFKRGRAILTTAVDGHSHLVMLDDFEGMPLSSGTTSWQDEHSHPFIIDDEGKLLIGVENDHDHAQEAISKNDLSEEELTDLLKDYVGNPLEEDDMTEAEKKTLEKVTKQAEDLEKSNAELKARADRAEKMAGLTDVQKAYCTTLNDAGKDEFLNKSADDRSEIVKAAAAAAAEENPVVYKSDTGDVYRKKDDPRLITLAKRADEDRKALLKAQQENNDQTLRKRAETELANLPGTVETRVSLLKAAEAIEDEKERGEAVAALKAHNAQMGKSFTVLGSPTVQKSQEEIVSNKASAEAELETAAKAIQKAEPTLDYYDAYHKAGEQNPELLAKAVAG